MISSYPSSQEHIGTFAYMIKLCLQTVKETPSQSERLDIDIDKVEFISGANITKKVMQRQNVKWKIESSTHSSSCEEQIK